MLERVQYSRYKCSEHDLTTTSAVYTHSFNPGMLPQCKHHPPMTLSIRWSGWSQSSSPAFPTFQPRKDGAASPQSWNSYVTGPGAFRATQPRCQGISILLTDLETSSPTYNQCHQWRTLGEANFIVATRAAREKGAAMHRWVNASSRRPFHTLSDFMI